MTRVMNKLMTRRDKMKFKVLTDRYHTLKAGDIIEGHDLELTQERLRTGTVEYLEGYRISNGVRVPWIFPADHFEPIIVKEEV